MVCQVLVLPRGVALELFGDARVLREGVLTLPGGVLELPSGVLMFSGGVLALPGGVRVLWGATDVPLHLS